jgi:hypothetical protein
VHYFNILGYPSRNAERGFRDSATVLLLGNILAAEVAEQAGGLPGRFA